MIVPKSVLALSALALAADAFVITGSNVMRPTLARNAVIQRSATATADTDILDVLASEHHEALDMLKQMEKSTDPEEMRILNDKVIIKLVAHSVVEETLVYPLLAEKLPNGREETNKDKDEHHELEVLMRELEKSNPTQPNFNTAVKNLAQALEHHRTKEEKEQFPVLRKAISKEDLKGIVGKAEALRKFAPTHPHPVTHVSHSKEFDTTVGTVVGLVDRVRDAVTGRTTDELSEVSRQGYGKDN